MSKATTRAQERAERAAAALAEQRRKERRRTVIAVVGVVLAMLVIVGGGVLLGKLSSNGPTGTAGSGDTVGVAIGPADAPHTVVVYEDFICPYCGELEKASREQLQELADDGRARVEYRPFQLLDIDYSRTALQVFGALRSLGDDAVTKEFHDLLYDNQPSEEGPFPGEDDVIALAVRAGADEAAVRDALDTGKDWADQATSDASDAGIRSTPTVFLDGSRFTDYTGMDDLATNLEKAVS